jgi:hypothetical protein
MDVHKESISIAVRNSAGKIVMECVIDTKASMIPQFVDFLTSPFIELTRTCAESMIKLKLYD